MSSQTRQGERERERKGGKGREPGSEREGEREREQRERDGWEREGEREKAEDCCRVKRCVLERGPEQPFH